MTTPVSRNVINVDEIETWIEILLQERSIENGPAHLWSTTVLKNYLLKQHYKLKLVAPINQRTLFFWVASQIGSARTNLPDFESTETRPWLATAFERGDTVCKVILDQELKFQVEHLLDYVLSRNWPDITRATYHDMVSGATRWVETLLKQKTIESDLKHVKVIAEGEVNGLFYRIVELVTKEAYQFEGKRMNNCVSGYYSKLPKTEREWRDKISAELKADTELAAQLQAKTEKLQKLEVKVVIDKPTKAKLRAIVEDEAEDDADDEDEDEEYDDEGYDDEDADEEGEDDEDDDEDVRPRRRLVEKKPKPDRSVEVQFRGIWSLRDADNKSLITMEMHRAYKISTIGGIDPVTNKPSNKISVWFTNQMRGKGNSGSKPEHITAFRQLTSSMGVKECTKESAVVYLLRLASEVTQFCAKHKDVSFAEQIKNSIVSDGHLPVLQTQQKRSLKDSTTVRFLDGNNFNL